MRKFTLTRMHQTHSQILGRLQGDINKILSIDCPTLELSDKDNQVNISCIPHDKTYRVTAWDSPKHGKCFKVNDVPDRTHILIHAGNFHTDIKGCILVGMAYGYLDNNDEKDLVNSKEAFGYMLDLFPDEWELRVIYG